MEISTAVPLEPSPPEAKKVLAGLGVHRVVVPIPFEEEGPVNVFVIEDDDGKVTLFDTGVSTEAGSAALLEGLSRLGLSPEDVARVICSHGHLDHFGNAAFFAERGAQVLVHPGDWNKISPSPEWQAARGALYHALFLRLGVAEADIDPLEAGWEVFRRMTRWVPRAHLAPIEPGMEVRFARFSARLLHVPGHTPGICVLWAEEARLMLTADHLLEHTSPNPVMEPALEGEAPRALVSYLESVRRVKEMPVRWVGPGHGPLWRGHRAHIERLEGFYRRRQAKILEALEAVPDRTVDQLGAGLFQRVHRRARFLVLSEVLGNLEVLEAEGRAQRRTEGNVWRWRASPDRQGQ